ncbi:peptide chain release factor N(5)-glutamine methyltransferase [Thermocoleostomius sinensis]|uniref:Release factor glutamine methyltransferase n=1 Tax=Thermocoleostomius sinensis A174 TaxID=2016057 RepID=A0A9E8ZH29_9CYAN|nr:peptide chain release factor N(5)-glutamine methyltransferase [Thermocoleostomius sinensis]WAL62631.1 peptide chain release factor N(5)-glutamine methyltransferase [Thermocoleostomius sinensis A174]
MHRTSQGDLWHWRQTAHQQAIAANIPPVEVDWLLQHLTGLDRLRLRLLSPGDPTVIDLKYSLYELDQRWHQRLNARTPVQYLVGATPWRRFMLKVSPAVLIPRPETESIIDLAIDAVQTHSELGYGHWADLGTGSGAIALGLADAFAEAMIHAVDYSPDALAIARFNAQQSGFSDRIRFYQGHWFEPLTQLQGHLRGMVSNPPYIPSDMVAKLQPEVADHEPALALDGGADGLDCIRYLVAEAPNYLVSGGVWLIEMMVGQAENVVNLLQSQGCYRDVHIYPDLAGVDRFALAYRV